MDGELTHGIMVDQCEETMGFFLQWRIEENPKGGSMGLLLMFGSISDPQKGRHHSMGDTCLR